MNFKNHLRSVAIAFTALPLIGFATPPTFSHPDSSMTLPEGKGVGTTVFKVNATDPDGTNITYSVNPETHFTIVSGSDTVTLRRALDHETASTHTVSIIATDADGETATTTLNINVTDDTEITTNPSDLGPNFLGQKGIDSDVITTRRFAVYLIRFKDADLSKFPGGANPVIPTKEEWHEILNGKLIQDYWHAQSWGQFSPTMDVFGYFDHPKRIDEMPADYTEMMNQLGNINVDVTGYDRENYHHHVFLFVNDSAPDWYAGAGAGLTSNLSINGVVTPWTKTILHGGYINRSGRDRLSNQVTYGFVNHLDQWEEGSNNYPLVRFQRTYLHEATHSLGLQWHENFASNSDRPAWQLPLQPNVTKDEINGEYDHPFALLGRSHFSMNMTAAGRDKLGWSNASNRYSVKRPGKHTVRIQPINRTTGYRMIEVRIPHRINQFWEFSHTKNHGYLLEVREQDIWSGLDNPGIIENTRGVLVQATDGDASRMLDMSPSPLLVPWNDNRRVIDMRDLALKPGMVFRNHEVEFYNVIAHEDGSFSIDIEILGWAGTEMTATKTLEEFRHRYFNTTANSGAAADSSDPDLDGLPNLLEHVLGTDPTIHHITSDFLRTRQVTINEEIYLEITTKSVVVAEIGTTIALESTVDLATWNQQYFEVVSNVLAHNFDAREEMEDWSQARLVTYRTKQPISMNEQLFWRISAYPNTNAQN